MCVKTMLYDTVLVLWLYALAFLRTANTSRISFNDNSPQGNWLTREQQILKARARWKAAMIIGTSDDEDLVLPNDDGSGWNMPRDETDRHFTQYTGSIARPDTSTCCYYGKMSATKGNPCQSSYYSKQYRDRLKRYRLLRYKQRLKLFRTRYGNNYRQNLMDNYQKCALRQQGQFQKCCNAEYYHKKRRQQLFSHRNLRINARYRNHRFKRKRRRQ